MVYRIYVEKKKELANEAGSLLNDLRSLLGIGGLEGLRVLNRYDAEGISRELFDHAVKTVFSFTLSGVSCRTGSVLPSDQQTNL